MKLTGDRCRCSTGHEYFNSSAAFDKHRIGAYTPGSRRCRSAEEMATAGMARNAKNFWVTEKFDAVALGRVVSAAIYQTPRG